MITGKTVIGDMVSDSSIVIQDGTPLVLEERFTTQFFEEFLLDTILTEVRSCRLHADCLRPTRKLLTALGKLGEQWYFVQLASDARSFGDVQILRVSRQFVRQLGVVP